MGEDCRCSSWQWQEQRRLDAFLEKCKQFLVEIQNLCYNNRDRSGQPERVRAGRVDEIVIARAIGCRPIIGMRSAGQQNGVVATGDEGREIFLFESAVTH